MTFSISSRRTSSRKSSKMESSTGNVTSPLQPSTRNNNTDIEFTPAQQEEREAENFATGNDPLELWRRLTPFALDELVPTFTMNNKGYKRRKKMVRCFYLNCSQLYNVHFF